MLKYTPIGFLCITNNYCKIDFSICNFRDAADKTTSSMSNAVVFMTFQGDTSKPYNKIHSLFKPSSYCSSQNEVILKCKTKGNFKYLIYLTQLF